MIGCGCLCPTVLRLEKTAPPIWSFSLHILLCRRINRITPALAGRILGARARTAGAKTFALRLLLVSVRLHVRSRPAGATYQVSQLVGPAKFRADRPPRRPHALRRCFFAENQNARLRELFQNTTMRSCVV